MSSPPSRWIERASQQHSRTAIVADDGTYSYEDLLAASATAATELLGEAGDLDQEPVAFLVPPSYAHVVVQWGIWRAGGVAVPLCLSHPRPELEYVLQDAGCRVLVISSDQAQLGRELAASCGVRVVVTTDLVRHESTASPLPTIDATRRAMIVYTSGTTSRPKGAVWTHHNLEAQLETLVEAWGWQRDDRILLALPLHHVHGIVNVLCCALRVGATCEILPRFDAREVWQRFSDSPLTLFMAVPTIYSRLIAEWERSPPATQAKMSSACSRLRLMVSGSAALPVSVLEKWYAISGHVLLERYGMTEIGMALSNPLHGERRAGCVGVPLPSVEVRLADETGRDVGPGESGEILVRGPSVFLEYWQQPTATRDAFRDGWFRTGDVARVDKGSYRILGRQSVDIIKTGGYKVSALEIEDVLRTHPDVDECAVVGLPDEEWGERVAVAIQPHVGAEMKLEALRKWAHSRLAAYKIPTRLLVVEALPRNALGKVVKPTLRKQFESAPFQRSDAGR